MSAELYLNDLKNKEIIEEFEEKIVKIELELNQIENQQLVYNNHLEETENKLNTLRKRVLDHSNNENIKNEIKEAEKELKKSQKTLNDLNNQISGKKIELLKLQQARSEEIRTGLMDYFYEIKLKCDKLRQRWANYTELVMNTQDELKKVEDEMGYVKRVIEIEFGESNLLEITEK